MACIADKTDGTPPSVGSRMFPAVGTVRRRTVVPPVVSRMRILKERREMPKSSPARGNPPKLRLAWKGGCAYGRADGIPSR